jgi:signal peptidase II
MQAARGASLTSSDAGSSSPTTSSSAEVRRTCRTVFVLVALAAYTVDVVSKAWAVEGLADGDIDVLGDWFSLHLVRNPGAAFSTGTELTVVFSLVAITAVCVVLWFGRRLGNVVWAAALGLLLAGIGGNLTDRLLREPGPLRGHVVDMFAVPHWPVFNVADVCIDLAAGLILLQAFRNVRLDGSRPVHGDSRDGDADEVAG